MNTKILEAADAMSRVYLAALGQPGKGYADLPASEQQVAVAMTRAVLAAVRVPDGEMEVVAHRAVAEKVGGNDAPAPGDLATAWTAMVDVLLDVHGAAEESLAL